MADVKNTKKEILEQNEKLREIAKEYKEKLESLEVQLSSTEDLPLIAYSFFKTGNTYKKVKLNFHPETLKAKVVSIEDATRVPNSFSMTNMEAKRVLVEEILKQEFEVK